LAITIIQLIARGIQVDTSMLIIDVWKGELSVVPLTPKALIVSVGPRPEGLVAVATTATEVPGTTAVVT